MKAVHGVSPRIRIAGISEVYSENTLLDYIRRLNPTVFSVDSKCTLLKFQSIKKKKESFQAVLQIDKVTYDRAIKRGYLLVGYDSCKVSDAIEVFRCFKCNEFEHSSRSCSSPLCCPRCSGSHEVKQCQSLTLSCSNCKKLHVKDINVAIDHAAWDTSRCCAYIQACEKLRSDVLSIPLE